MDETQSPLHLLIFPSLACIFLSWAIFRYLRQPAASSLSPPSPPKLPILGNLHLLGSLSHQDFHLLARKHGPLMLLHLGRTPVLVVSSADAAREIMKTHDIIFSDRAVYKVQSRLMYECKDLSLAPYGEYWRNLKRIFAVQLLSNKRVQSFRSIREEETTLLVNKIADSTGPVNLTELLPEFTSSVVCRSAFGWKYSESENGSKFVRLLGEFSELMGNVGIADFIPWLSWISRVNGLDRRVERLAKEMDDFLEDVIEKRLKQDVVFEKKAENFLDIMLEIYKDKTCDVSIVTDTIKATILDVFFAGTDSVSTVIEWAMAELLKHPIVMSKLQKEVREIIGDKHDITEEDLEQMAYLKSVIKETLRCHPSFPLLIPRVAREDVIVKGYLIAKGTNVMINAWAIGRDPLSWDDAEEFKPERFLDSAVDFKGMDFELIPFGAGRRGCPGIAYSIETIELLLAHLVQKFEWKLPGEVKGEEMDMSERPGGTVRRDLPLLTVATLRSSYCYEVVGSVFGYCT